MGWGGGGDVYLAAVSFEGQGRVLHVLLQPAVRDDPKLAWCGRECECVRVRVCARVEGGEGVRERCLIYITS